MSVFTTAKRKTCHRFEDFHRFFHYYNFKIGGNLFNLWLKTKHKYKISIVIYTFFKTILNCQNNIISSTCF